jgi:hypothetical protein
MGDYADTPIELTTNLRSEQVRKIVNKSLKTFGGYRYRPDKNATEFRCEVASGDKSGGTVVVEILEGGTEIRIRMVVTDSFISRRLGVKHTMGVVKANAAIDQIIKKACKDDPSARVQPA